MKGALGKKELLAVVPVSMSTIDRMEKNGEFPKRFWITDKRCAWNSEEIERWLDERQQNGTTEFAGKSLRLSSEYFAPLVTRRDVAGEVLGKVVRMVSVPGRRIRLAVPAGGHFWRGSDTMNRMEKYHADYVSQRKAPPLVAVTPAAMEIEQRAIARENKGQYRLAARLWLECMDAATGEVERARIAIRRDQCIGRGNRLRQGCYAGICATAGVIYD